MIQLAQTDDELQRCTAVLGQLRSEVPKDQLLSRIKVQMLEGYRIAYVAVDGAVFAVAGFRFAENLAWGKHLYIDDLVSDENHRSMHYGASLFQYLCRYAKEHHCGVVHLDSGVQRFSAHKFYFREGLKITSYHFSMRLESDDLRVS